MTDNELAELQARNAERVAAAKEWLGRKWLLHPTHAATNRNRKLVAIIEPINKGATK
jgi:hypothetical protein